MALADHAACSRESPRKARRMPPRRLKKARIAMTLPHLAPATNQRVAGRESDHPAEFERPARHPNLAVVRLILQSRRASIPIAARSEEHTSELQSLMRISYAVFCLKKQTQS